MKLSGPIELIKKTFTIFFKKENLIYFLEIYAVLIPFTIFFYAQNSFYNISTKNLNFSGIGQFLSKYGPLFWIIFIVVGFVYLIISFWVLVSGIKATANVVGGAPLDVMGTFRSTWKKLWGFFLVGFLSGLIEVGGLIISSALWGILALAFPLNSSINANPFGIAITVIKVILILGALASLVFMFVFAVWFVFSQYVYITEGLGVRDSLRRSRDLVKGKYWQIVWRLFVFGIFTFLVQLVFGLIPFVGTILTTLAGALFILPTYLLYTELKS